MKEFLISDRQAGQRLDKYLAKVLDRAPKSFLYKMMRKKNIVLNDKKADGKEILQKNDAVRIYFSDETFARFSSGGTGTERAAMKNRSVDRTNPQIIYENEDFLFVDKPAGVLSQKAKDTDDSINEWAIRYLLRSGQLKEEDLTDFRPSIGNRLDRNTSGLITVGKTVSGLQQLGIWFHDHTAKKYYRCIVAGEIRSEGELDGYLIKDAKTNQVRITEKEESGAQRISLSFRPVANYAGYTDLEILLKTGRTHQIRAQMAQMGNPILGDPKYGDRKRNGAWKTKTGLSRQLLHAYRLALPDGRIMEAPLPEDYRSVLDSLQDMD